MIFRMHTRTCTPWSSIVRIAILTRQIKNSTDQVGEVDQELQQLLFWRRIFIAALIVLLIPLGIISFYNHASADDYVWATYQYHGLRETGILGFLKGCYQIAHWNYFDHHGEYAAILLGVLNPLAVDDDWYWVTGFVMIGFLVFSVFCMWRLIADGSRKENVLADIAACVTCIILIELVPRAIDMFYWFDGAVNYTPYYAMMLIMTGMFVRLCRQGCLSRRNMVIMCVLTWFSMGGNAIPLVVNLVIVIGWGYAAFMLYGNKQTVWGGTYRGYWKYYGIILLSAIVGVLTDLVAPGNEARMADEGENKLTSVWEIITRTIDYSAASVRNQMSMMLLMLLALFIPLFWIWAQRVIEREEREGHRSVFSLPVFVVVAYAFLLHCSAYAPTIWIYGTEGEYRMEDIRFFYLVLYLILLEFYLVGKAALTLRGMGIKAERMENAGAGGRILSRFLAADLAMILVFGTAYYVLPETNRDSISSLSAALSLVKGEAQLYDEEIKAQQAILEDPATTGEDVEVQAVTSHPRLLFAWGLEMSDPESWINKAVAEYYDKASVTLIRDVPVEEE